MKMVMENPPPTPSSHTPPQGMGAGPAWEAAYLGWVGAKVGVYLRISFGKEKVRLPPQEEYQYKDLTNVAKPRATQDYVEVSS